jgi:predicted anti-sigma-YlaC factor YlaD
LLTHPSADALVAYADGDAEGVDLARIAEHVSGCAACREAVAELARVRGVLRESAEKSLPPPRDGWTALSTKIARHRRDRAAAGWTGGLLAASLAGIVLLSQLRSRPGDGGSPADSAIGDVYPVVSGGDETIVELSRAVARGRGGLPASERQAMEAVLASIDEAVRQTRSALDAEPSNPDLRSHLGELHRKRVSALQDYVDLIRDHG